MSGVQAEQTLMSLLIKRHPKLLSVSYRGQTEILWLEKPITESSVKCKVIDSSHASLVGATYPQHNLRSEKIFITSPTLNYRHTGLVSRYLRHHTSGHEAPLNDLGPPLLHPSSNSNVCDAELRNRPYYGEYPALFQEVNGEERNTAPTEEATPPAAPPLQPASPRPSGSDKALHHVRRESGSSSSSRSSIYVVRRSRFEPKQFVGPRAQRLVRMALEGGQLQPSAETARVAPTTGVVEEEEEGHTMAQSNAVPALATAVTTNTLHPEETPEETPRETPEETPESHPPADVPSTSQITDVMDYPIDNPMASGSNADSGTQGEHEEAEEAIPHSTEPPVVNDETSNNAAQHVTAVPQVPQQQVQVDDIDNAAPQLHIQLEAPVQLTNVVPPPPRSVEMRDIINHEEVDDLVNLEAEQREVKRLSKVHEKTAIELRKTQAEHKKLTDLLKDCEARRDALTKRLTLEKQQLNLAIKKADRSKRRHVLQEKQARERARVGQVGEVQRQAQKRRQDEDEEREGMLGKRIKYSPMRKEKRKSTKRARPVSYGSNFGGHGIRRKPKKSPPVLAESDSDDGGFGATNVASPTLPNNSGLATGGVAGLGDEDLAEPSSERSCSHSDELAVLVALSDDSEEEQDSCSSSDKLAALTVPNNSSLATGEVAGLGDKKTPGATGSRGSDNACDMARGASSTGEPAAQQSYVKPPIDPINSSLAAEGAAALGGEACDGHRPRSVTSRTRKSSTESLPATTAYYYTRSRKRATEEAADAEDATGPSYGSAMGTEKTHNLRSSKSCKRRRSY